MEKIHFQNLEFEQNTLKSAKYRGYKVIYPPLRFDQLFQIVLFPNSLKNIPNYLEIPNNVDDFKCYLEFPNNTYNLHYYLEIPNNNHFQGLDFKR